MRSTKAYWSGFPSYAIHNLPGAPVGQVSTRIGLICSSESLFEITITGRGGHASMPQIGVDVITVGAELVQAIQAIVARKLAPGAGGGVGDRVSDWMGSAMCCRATLRGDVGRLGHRVGLQLTEWPWHAEFDETLTEEGRLLTLEPSPGYGDGRIMVHEENIVVRANGAEFLSTRVASELPVI